MTHPWHESINWPGFLQPLSSPDELVLPAVASQHRALAQERAHIPSDPSKEVEGCPHQIRLALGETVSADTFFDALAWRSCADSALEWPLPEGVDSAHLSDSMQQELAVVLAIVRSPDISTVWQVQDDVAVDVLDAIVARGFPVALRAALSSPTCPALKNLQDRHGQASLGFKHPRSMPWLHAAISMDSPLVPVMLEHGFDPCRRDYKGQPAWTLASSSHMLDALLARIHSPLSMEDLRSGLLQWVNGPGKNSYCQRVEVLCQHAKRWQQPPHDLDAAQAMVLVERRRTPMRQDGNIGWAAAPVSASHLQSLSWDCWRTEVVEPSWPLEDKRMTLADAVAWRTMSEFYPCAEYGVSKVLAHLPTNVHSDLISNQVPGVHLRHTVSLAEKTVDSSVLRHISWNADVVPALASLLRAQEHKHRGPGLHVPGLARSLGGWAHTWKMADKVNPATWALLGDVVQQTAMDLNQAPESWITSAIAALQSPRLTHEGACAVADVLVALCTNLNIEGDHAINTTQRQETFKALDLLLEVQPHVPALSSPRLPSVIDVLTADRDDAAAWKTLKVQLRARVLDGQWTSDAPHSVRGARL